MSVSLTHMLHRLGRLKQRFEAERRASAPSPLRLLKLRAVILRAERHLQSLSAARLGRSRRLHPAMATALSLRSRG